MSPVGVRRYNLKYVRDFYHVIADIDELKWFFDHCVHPPKRNEAYAFCLSFRNKKLTDEEKEALDMPRSEMLDPQVVMAHADMSFTFNDFLSGIARYEVNKAAFTTRSGEPYLEKSMVCYFHINPCDELSVVKDLKKYIQIHEQELIDSAMRTEDRTKALNNLISEIVESGSANKDQINRVKMLSTKSDESGVNQSLYKMCKSLSKMKRLQFDNVGSKYWVDFDMDLKKEVRGTKTEEELIALWKKYLSQKLRKGKYVLIKTGGGVHTMVDKDEIRFNPNWFIDEFLHFVSTGLEVPEGAVTKDTKPYTNPFVNGEPKNYKFSDLTKENIYDKKGNGSLWENWIQLKDPQTKDDKLYYTPSFFIDELVYNMNAMLGVPGTYMYGSHVIRVLNKEDFD